MDYCGVPASAKGGGAMNYVWLSPEQRQEVCEDLLLIERAGRMQEVWSLRRMWLRDYRPASAWVQVEADRLAREASRLCGGSLAQWREAAAAALGFPSQAAIGIEAVCEVADGLRMREQQAPQVRFTMNKRKRGGR